MLVDSLHPTSTRRSSRCSASGVRAGAAGRSLRNVEGVTYADLLASDDVALRAARDFPPVPLIALQHGISFDPGGEPVSSIERLWGEAAEANSSLSPEGRVVVAEQSHHRIAGDQPGVVVDAIREVRTAARAG